MRRSSSSSSGSSTAVPPSILNGSFTEQVDHHGDHRSCSLESRVSHQQHATSPNQATRSPEPLSPAGAKGGESLDSSQVIEKANKSNHNSHSGIFSGGGRRGSSTKNGGDDQSQSPRKHRRFSPSSSSEKNTLNRRNSGDDGIPTVLSLSKAGGASGSQVFSDLLQEELSDLIPINNEKNPTIPAVVRSLPQKHQYRHRDQQQQQQQYTVLRPASRGQDLDSDGYVDNDGGSPRVTVPPPPPKTEADHIIADLLESGEWSIAFDPETGRPYYFSTVDFTTTWDLGTLIRKFRLGVAPSPTKNTTQHQHQHQQQLNNSMRRKSSSRELHHGGSVTGGSVRGGSSAGLAASCSEVSPTNSARRSEASLSSGAKPNHIPQSHSHVKPAPLHRKTSYRRQNAGGTSPRPTTGSPRGTAGSPRSMTITGGTPVMKRPDLESARRRRKLSVGPNAAPQHPLLTSHDSNHNMATTMSQQRQPSSGGRNRSATMTAIPTTRGSGRAGGVIDVDEMFRELVDSSQASAGLATSRRPHREVNELASASREERFSSRRRSQSLHTGSGGGPPTPAQSGSIQQKQLKLNGSTDLSHSLNSIAEPTPPTSPYALLSGAEADDDDVDVFALEEQFQQRLSQGAMSQNSAGNSPDATAASTDDAIPGSPRTRREKSEAMNILRRLKNQEELARKAQRETWESCGTMAGPGGSISPQRGVSPGRGTRPLSLSLSSPLTSSLRVEDSGGVLSPTERKTSQQRQLGNKIITHSKAGLLNLSRESMTSESAASQAAAAAHARVQNLAAAKKEMGSSALTARGLSASYNGQQQQHQDLHQPSLTARGFSQHQFQSPEHSQQPRKTAVSSPWSPPQPQQKPQPRASDPIQQLQRQHREYDSALQATPPPQAITSPTSYVHEWATGESRGTAATPGTTGSATARVYKRGEEEPASSRFRRTETSTTETSTTSNKKTPIKTAAVPSYSGVKSSGYGVPVQPRVTRSATGNTPTKVTHTPTPTSEATSPSANRTPQHQQRQENDASPVLSVHESSPSAQLRLSQLGEAGSPTAESNSVSVVDTFASTMTRVESTHTSTRTSRQESLNVAATSSSLAPGGGRIREAASAASASEHVSQPQQTPVAGATAGAGGLSHQSIHLQENSQRRSISGGEAEDSSSVAPSQTPTPSRSTSQVNSVGGGGSTTSTRYGAATARTPHSKFNHTTTSTPVVKKPKIPKTLVADRNWADEVQRREEAEEAKRKLILEARRGKVRRNPSGSTGSNPMMATW